VLLSAVAVLLAAWGAGCTGGSSSSGSNLYLEEFLYDGTSDVPRNAPLHLVFNSAINRQSVSVAGLSVVKPNGEVFPGRIEIEGRTITFYPTVLAGDRNDYVPDNQPPPNGLAFAPKTKYRIKLLGNHPLGIRNSSGQTLDRNVTLTFTTGLVWAPEDPPVYPTFETDPPMIEFDPEPIVDGDPLDPNPENQPLVTPRLKSVRVSFSEPMNPASFDPLSTFRVRNISQTTTPLPGLGEPIPGSIVWSPDARTFQFNFLFTLGDDPNTTDPFEFVAELTEGVTDLAGNRLSKTPEGEPLDGGLFPFYFLTEDLQGEPSYRLILESFDTTENKDTIHDETTAVWEGTGAIEGGEITIREHDFRQIESPYNLPDPLRTEGSHFQMIFYKTNTSEPADGEVMSGMSWSPRSNYLFASRYSDLKFWIGHTTGGSSAGLNKVYAYNYIGDPILMFNGDFDTPNSLSTEWFPWPEWADYFEFDIDNNLLIEVDNPGGDTYQLFRNQSGSSLPRRRNIGPSGAVEATNTSENTQYWTRFQFSRITTVGYSVFFDTGVNRPNYLDPVVDIDPDRPGTTVRVEFQGAFDDGEGNPAEPWSIFVEDIHLLEIYRHVRFRILLTADPVTQIVPAVRSLAIIYEL